MAAETPVLFVLAGVNGAGKSSIGGAYLRQLGLAYFNPDEAAQRIRMKIGCSTEEANSLAWAEGKRRLEEAIESRSNYAFETTLGEKPIAALLVRAADSDIEVLLWFAKASHDIPDASRRNLITLMPLLTELRVFDNSREADPATGSIPEPLLLLHLRRGRIIAPPIEALASTPEWAKAIVARAMQIHRR